jgi:NhaP-type Na+/H+ or K+/H+ antiporter
MAKTEEDDILRLPQRHLSELEVQYINLSIEKARLKREQSQNILNKGLMLFFAFILLGLILTMNDFISKMWANILILAGLVVLGISVLPYMSAVKEEEQKLNRLMETLIGEKPKD